MITLLVYLIVDFVLIFSVSRFYFSNKKSHNQLLFYFMMAVAILAIGQTLNIIFILWYLATKTGVLLYWADILGRIAQYGSIIFFVQVPLYILFPKSTKRIWASYFLTALGVLMFAYFLRIPYQPVLNSDGIINWATPLIISLPLGIILLLVWLASSAVFFYEYIKSKFKSKKSLVLGLGFLFASFGAVLQDFGKTRFEYISVNLLLLLSMTLIFVGAFIKDK